MKICSGTEEMKVKVKPRQRKLYRVHTDLWKKMNSLNTLYNAPVFDLGSGGADGSGRTVVPISPVLTFMCGLNLLHMVIPAGGSQFTCQVVICMVIVPASCLVALRRDRPSCFTPLIQGEVCFSFYHCPK